MSGHYKGREIDYEIELVESECGLVLEDGREQNPCAQAS